MEELSPLIRAAYAHDWTTVDRIHRTGEGSLSTCEAAIVGDIPALRTSLERDPAAATGSTSDGFTPLHLAAYFGRAEAVALLLDADADPDAVASNATELRPLHSAVAARAPACVRLLLVAGADPNVRQQGGYTPLMAAARHGQTEIVAMLLAHGADPDVRSDDGKTAAEMAPGPIPGLSRH